MEEGGVGYQFACGAAIQNMLLAGHALGFEGLWFIFFDKKAIRKILGVQEKKVPIGMVCL